MILERSINLSFASTGFALLLLRMVL